LLVNWPEERYVSRRPATGSPAKAMKRTLALALLGGALNLTATSHSHAADEMAEREAQARFEEGLRRVKAGDFEGARVSFVQAYAVLHRPRILMNLALCEERTGRATEALTHFKQVTRDALATEADRDDAQTHAAGLAGQVGHIEVRAPPGGVLMVDGGPPAGTTPLLEPLDVTPGHHVIEAKLAQGTQAIVVDLSAGQVVHIRFGQDEPRPRAPMVAAAVPGSATGPGFATATATATGSANAIAPATSVAEAPSSRGAGAARAIVSVSLAAVGAGAIAVGIGFALGADNASSDIQRLKAANPSCPPPVTMGGCQQLASAAQTRSDDINAARGFLVAGGVLLAGGVATWLFWPKGKSHSIALVPLASEHQAGAVVVGRF
jgi:hypothetical protein